EKSPSLLSVLFQRGRASGWEGGIAAYRNGIFHRVACLSRAHLIKARWAVEGWSPWRDFLKTRTRRSGFTGRIFQRVCVTSQSRCIKTTKGCSFFLPPREELLQSASTIGR